LPGIKVKIKTLALLALAISIPLFLSGCREESTDFGG